MAPRGDLAFLLGDQWRRGLRRLAPGQLVRAAVLLARQETLPETVAACDATGWGESRRQRLDAVLRQLCTLGDGAPDLSTRDWASLLWSLARCRAVLPPDVARAATAAMAGGGLGAGVAEPSDVSRMMWAAGTLSWRDQDFLDSIVASGAALLPQCSPQDLSNVVWSAAVLGTERVQLFGLEAAEVFARRFQVPAGSATTLSPSVAARPPAQAVANILWAVAKIKESRGASPVIDTVAELLAPVAAESLETATSQGVANMLWAFARLDAKRRDFVEAACDSMVAALPTCEPQHMATAAWAVARLATSSPASPSASSTAVDGRSTSQAAIGGVGVPGKREEALLVAIAEHLHGRVRSGTGSGQNLKRWASCSMRHVSMLSWAYVRVLPRHQATRSVLRDALEHAEELMSDQGQLKAQEHANILWAWSEGLSAWIVSERPAKVLKRLIALTCSSTLKLTEDNPVAWVMACGALAKLHRVVDSPSRQLIEGWLERSSRRCVQNDFLAQLKPSDVVSVLQSMMTTKVLHAKLYHAALKALQDDGRSSGLQTFSFVALVDAAAFLRPEQLPRALVELLGEAVSRLHEFDTQDVASLMGALLRLSHTASSARLDFDALLRACTQALGQRGLRLPDGGPPRGRAAEFTAATDFAVGAASSLSTRDWVWVMSSISPLTIGGAEGSRGPDWMLERLVRPWEAWLRRVARELAAEAAALHGRRAAASDVLAATARWRYDAVLARYGLDGLGPRWTAVALTEMGADYLGPSEVPEAALRALEAERRLRSDGGRFGRCAWLRARLAAAGETRELVEVLWDGSPADEHQDKEGSALPEFASSSPISQEVTQVLQADPSRSWHAEMQVLRRLQQHLLALGSCDQVAGDVTLYVSGAPCLSCLGAVTQLTLQWPALAVRVGFEHGPSDSQAAAVARASLPALEDRSDEPDALSSEVRKFLEAYAGDCGSTAPISVVGSHVPVQDVWARVCGTGVRPSGKNVSGKKREWQDKLRYFLSHRPHDFEVDVGPPARVHLVLPELAEEVGTASADERRRAFADLAVALEAAALRLLERGKALRGCPAGEGFVPIEEVASDEHVSPLWRQLRADSGDRLAYFLRHCSDFEVWAPQRLRDIAELQGAPGGDRVGSDTRTWMRARLL